MAQVKISALTDADPLSGTESAPFVQGGATKGATVDQIKTYIDSTRPWRQLLAPSSSSGSLDIDLAIQAGYATTLTENVTTLTFSNAPAGLFIEFTVAWTQDATGGWAVTFPASVQNPPVIDAAANAVTITRFATWDGGATIHTVDDGATYYAVS